MAGTVTDNLHSPAYVQFGPLATGNYWYGVDENVYGGSGLEFNNGATTNLLSTTNPSDGGSVMAGVSTTGSSTFDVDNTSTSNALTGRSGAVIGGALGAAANGKGTSGHVDEAAVIIVPWTISATQRKMLETSLYQTFQIQPQHIATVALLGDSHGDDWGQPYQQSWFRQMQALLNRPDVRFVNASQAGAGIGTLVGTYAAAVHPAMTADTSSNKYVILQGGYNDLAYSTSVATIEGSFTTGIADAHADGAKAVCELDVLRDPTVSNQNQNIQTISAWEQSTLGSPTGCDYILNLQSVPVFDSVAGPWAAPWFQGDQTHLQPAGAGLEAEVGAKLFSTLLPP